MQYELQNGLIYQYIACGNQFVLPWSVFLGWCYFLSRLLLFCQNLGFWIGPWTAIWHLSCETQQSTTASEGLVRKFKASGELTLWLLRKFETYVLSLMNCRKLGSTFIIQYCHGIQFFWCYTSWVDIMWHA